MRMRKKEKIGAVIAVVIMIAAVLIPFIVALQNGNRTASTVLALLLLPLVGYGIYLLFTYGILIFAFGVAITVALNGCGIGDFLADLPLIGGIYDTLVTFFLFG